MGSKNCFHIVQENMMKKVINHLNSTKKLFKRVNLNKPEL